MRPEDDDLTSLLTTLGPADLVDLPEQWPLLAREDVWRGAAPFAVRSDQITLPDGGDPFRRLVVEHPGAVVILAVDEVADSEGRPRERVLVLRQYRHPAERRFVELPAGLLDQPGEDPVVAAQRELLEEAGLVARSWSPLSSIYTSPGINAERIEIYLATDLEHVPDRGGFHLHHEEADMTRHWVDLDDLLDACLERRLTDGPLVTAVLAYVVLRARGPRAV